MKLQLAIDDISLDSALSLVEEIKDYVDIIEMGTPFIIAEGINVIKQFKQRFPNKEILADEKIMDAGYYESVLGFKAGAHYVTVLGVTDLLTIQECVKAANEYKGKIVVDMICVEDMVKRIQEIEALNVDILAVHTGADQQKLGRNAIDDLKVMIQHSKHAQIAVAGGINSKTIKEYTILNPDIIIVGSSICHAKDPVTEAKMIKQAMINS